MKVAHFLNVEKKFHLPKKPQIYYIMFGRGTILISLFNLNISTSFGTFQTHCIIKLQNDTAKQQIIYPL